MAALLGLAACAHRPAIVPGPHLTQVGGSELPPPADVQPSGVRLYRVGPFDKLQISVFGIPELSQEVQVDSSGRFSLPLAGAVEALGKTPEQITGEIAALLRERYVRDPIVSVNLMETVNQMLTVEGQVREPGLYPVVANIAPLIAEEPPRTLPRKAPIGRPIHPGSL